MNDKTNDIPNNLGIDEAYIREKAERVSEDDIRYVIEHEDEIKETFIGHGPFGKFVEDIVLSFCIVKDYATGAYRKIPYWGIGAIVFMLLYVGNPIDLIPDFLIGVGQIDDLIVITLCLLMLRQELHEYKQWKAQQDDEEDDDDY
jgi:uncharacterized membrane protein YkvA (DUF1232 family)